MTIKDVGDIVQTLGIVGLLLVIVYGGQRGWWVYGRENRRLINELEEQRQETQRWQDMALHLLGLADRSVKQADQAISAVERQTKRRRNVDGE